MTVTPREEALAIHQVLVAFPGTKAEVVFSAVKEEALVLAGKRRKPKRKGKGTPG